MGNEFRGFPYSIDERFRLSSNRIARVYQSVMVVGGVSASSSFWAIFRLIAFRNRSIRVRSSVIPDLMTISLNLATNSFIPRLFCFAFWSS